MLGYLKWLLSKDEAFTDIEVAGRAMMYIGILSLTFVFLGYTAKVTLDNINVTDITALPIFGGVFQPLNNAMSVGATVILLFFLIMVIYALWNVVQQFGAVGYGAYRE
ncbi:hypothetical protein E3E31_08550 [Thermococcus sp. M39]|uniref:hypothetical protein n=1 Tax=Thermococcus sp. M39 TaxID=1638262 RepID=UPI00143AA333|nr:hypothetical protein [Thermococcus sp. M39]NJE08569.1 hypothetical protein [Thermococcus sp. M39]